MHLRRNDKSDNLYPVLLCQLQPKNIKFYSNTLMEIREIKELYFALACGITPTT
jgi:hypothetical protein